MGKYTSTTCACPTTSTTITQPDIPQTTPVVGASNVRVPLDCNIIDRPNLLSNYHTIKDESEKTSFRSCVLGLVQKNNLTQLLDTYNNTLNNYETVNELNKNSMSIYINDYWYIIVKSIIYSLVLLLFIYFYGITNIIESIKTSAVTIKDQTIKVKDKIVEVKEQIVDKTNK